MTEVQRPLGECKKCGKILDAMAVVFNGDHFHKECFVCEGIVCKGEKILCGNEGFFEIEGRNVCKSCYDEEKSTTCPKCNLIVKASEQKRTTKSDGKSYHETCFTCFKCDEIIEAEFFRDPEHGLLCSNCHVRDSSTCAKCGEKIVRGSLVNVGDHSYHSDCFVCVSCQGDLRNNGMFEGHKGKRDYYCKDCYSEKMAKRCFKCNVPLIENILKFRDETYCENCLVCSDCNKKLTGIKFTFKDGNFKCSKDCGQ